MGERISNYDFLSKFRMVPEGERGRTKRLLQLRQDSLSPIERITLEVLVALEELNFEALQSKVILSPERAQTLSALKDTYERLKHVSGGVSWACTENSLRAAPAQLDGLRRLMKERPNSDLTVVGRADGKIILMEVAPACPGIRDIVYDKAVQNEFAARKEHCKGNAVDIAAHFGAKPASPEHYQSLKGKIPGLDQRTRTRLFTDEDTRKNGYTLLGYQGGVYKYYAYPLYSSGEGVRCQLGVKEA